MPQRLCKEPIEGVSNWLSFKSDLIVEAEKAFLTQNLNNTEVK